MIETFVMSFDMFKIFLQVCNYIILSASLYAAINLNVIKIPMISQSPKTILINIIVIMFSVCSLIQTSGTLCNTCKEWGHQQCESSSSLKSGKFFANCEA